jgi:hypothetical protein
VVERASDGAQPFPEDAAYRDEIRAFIENNYPAEMRVANPQTDLSKEQMLL